MLRGKIGINYGSGIDGGSTSTDYEEWNHLHILSLLQYLHLFYDLEMKERWHLYIEGK